jgi:hypothetical protein
LQLKKKMRITFKALPSQEKIKEFTKTKKWKNIFLPTKISRCGSRSIPETSRSLPETSRNSIITLV